MAVALTVAEVMSRDVETVAPDATVSAAAERLRAGDIGSLVVVEDGSPVGLVTDRVLVGVLASGEDPATATVESVMVRPAPTVGPDARVGEAAARMRELDTKRLVVVEDGAIAGLVSTTDLAHYIPQVLHRSWLRQEPPERPTRPHRPEMAYDLDGWQFESMCVEEGTVSVGDRVEFSKPLSDDDVRVFARASGDTNRLHLDDEYAAETRFGGRIAHGTLVGGLISAALARLPGLTIYLSQDLSFLAPVEVGEWVTAVCEVVESLGRDRYVLTTDVRAADGETVIEGEAVVLIDPAPTPDAEPAEVEAEAPARDP